MEVLKLASCMAENTEVFCQALAIYVQRQLGLRTQYVGGIPWKQRERLFDQGEFSFCGFVGCPTWIGPILPTAA